MANITLYGASDDLLEANWTDGVTALNQCDEMTFKDHTDGYPYKCGWIITQPDCHPFAVYGHFDGTWSMSLGFIDADDEGADISEIPALFRRGRSCGYAVELVLTVATGTTIAGIGVEG